MPISRRGFLGYAAGASAMALAGTSLSGCLFGEELPVLPGLKVIDFGRQTVLPESAAGYDRALSRMGIKYEHVSDLPGRPVQGMILPAAPRMDAQHMARLRNSVEAGSAVLLESGAAFLSSEEFDSYQRSIKSVFGLSIRAPIRLWDSADSYMQSPYIDYGWPLKTKVRDFSRIIPVDGNGSEEIAWFQNTAVGARSRMGRGMLVFLGSLLGPHLLVGDPESARWLHQFCSLSCRDVSA